MAKPGPLSRISMTRRHVVIMLLSTALIALSLLVPLLIHMTSASANTALVKHAPAVPNNVGISNDKLPTAANYDGGGFSYSAQALKSVGIQPGKTISYNGGMFTWPFIAPGKVDNFQAQGQTLHIPKALAQGANTLTFIGSATNGPSIGTATLTYTDKSTQTFSLGFSDWTLNAGHATPATGNGIVAMMTYRNGPHAKEVVSTFVFAASIALQAGKTASSVTLPMSVNQGHLHVFTIGTMQSVVPTPTPPATPTPMPTVKPTPSPSPTPAPNGVAWPAFDGGGQRSGINTAETQITPANVANLTRIWQKGMPAVVDGAPVELPNVATAQGSKTLLFVTTKAGSLLAIDAATGNQVWRQDSNGPNFTTSSPALDPSGHFVYGYGLDGKVHKYDVGTGKETTDNTWPVTITHMPNVEKGSSPINVGNGFLYMPIAGYPGDGGHYEGHAVAVNLSTGAVTVFNALCANITHVLGPNECADVQTAIWARGGVVVDPVTGNVFVTTGNGPFRGDGRAFGDSVIELSPDLTKVIDSYTPGSFAQLQAADQDLGSAAPAILPKQASSSTPYLMVQAGKDNTLRLLNRQNLSGQGGPNHTGGELQMVALPQGGDVDTHPVVWNDGAGMTWVFVANFSGFSAFKVVTDGAGHTTLQLAYHNGNSGSSPFMANGVLFVQGDGVLRAMNPTTGAVLWSSTQASAGGSIGGLHWQSPIVVNGHVYVPDNAGNLSAYMLHQ